MDAADLKFTSDQWETMKIIIGVILLLPALIALRFLIFMFTPKFILKYFVRQKQGYKENKKRKKKFYED